MDKKNIPTRTLKRMSFYLSYLESVYDSKVEYISTPKIAFDLNYNEVSVKKDLSYITTIKGKPKVGHRVIDLISDLKHILGYNINKSACIIGCGNLGKALIKFQGFKKYGLEIVAAFDKSEDIIGKAIEGIIVEDVSCIKEYFKKQDIPIGIIAVSEENAQEVCNILIDCGVKAIWNFAPIQLKGTKDVIIQNENMASSLAILSSRINVR